MAQPEIPVTIDHALADRLRERGICESFLQEPLAFDKQSLTEGHAEAAAEFKRMADDPDCAKRKFSYHVLDPLWPSASFNALEDMLVDDLIAPDPATPKDPDKFPVTVHHGRILYGTLCAKPFLTGGVRTVLEDKMGRAVLVVIDNAVCTTASEADVCKKYPEGMKVAIKEPALTPLWLGGNLKYGIKVANPADIMPTADTSLADQAEKYLLESGREHVRQGLVCIKELHARGNGHLADNECSRALNCYTSGCTILKRFKDTVEDVLSSKPDPGEASTSTAGFKTEDPRLPDVLEMLEVRYFFEVNYFQRCEAHLRLGSYKKALADADMCLQQGFRCAKSKMQRAKCLHGMHQYSEEATSLEALQESLDTSEPASDLLAEIQHQKFRASIAMKQSGSGLYELDDEDFSRHSGTELAPGCAPFTGAIEIRNGSRGPGMFASQDVKPGELLLVSNPLARGKAHRTWPRIRFYCARSLWTGKKAEPGHLTSIWSARFQNLFVETIAKAQQSPQYSEQLKSMLRGSRAYKPFLDLFTKDWDDEQYGDVSSIAEHQRHLATVDIRDIRCVLETYGTFDGALHGLPSFFKHSCAPNCVRYTETTQSGGAMFIASTTRIPAGEELSIYFVSTFHSNFLRSEEFRRHFVRDFCSCPRCRFEDQVLTKSPDLRDLLCTYGYPGLAEIGAIDATKVENMLTTCSEAKDWLETILDDKMLTTCSEVTRSLGMILRGHPKLFNDEKQTNWIRCSLALAFVFPVLSCSESIRAGSMDEIVRVLTSVEPGTPTALTILALCIHKMQRPDIEQILEKRYLNQDLYFPFKKISYDNLLNWGRAHWPSLLSSILLEVTDQFLEATHPLIE